MQQTTKYQFNLVDATDDFSPDPLNQNAQKAETLIAGVESDLADLVTEVGAGGHNCRIAWGSYTGTGGYGAGSPNSLNVGFYPVLLLLMDQEEAAFSGLPAHVMRGYSVQNAYGGTRTWSWQDNGVSWYHDELAEYQYNLSGHTYLYCVLGYDNSQA